jgi:23S rRNA pseudouridine1911/1915/1917 synthase
MEQKIKLERVMSEEHAGLRLDQALGKLFSEYSRSRLKQWIQSGEIKVDGRVMRPRDPVHGGERIEINAILEEPVVIAQDIPLDILYEDESILVINKQPGMVVHTAAGNWEGTMQNALIHHVPETANLPRSGIVHRLDKETSGILVVAKTLEAHKHLVEELQQRAFEREYLAVVNGVMTAGGTVDEPIGRHPVDRKRMAVIDKGKPSVTHYRVVERYKAHTLIRVQLETGRTHQIRVHMAHIRYPIVGDPVYGGRLRIPPDCSEALAAAIRGFKRQALHAARLALIHPESGERMEWITEVPEDMQTLIRLLQQDAGIEPQAKGKC